MGKEGAVPGAYRVWQGSCYFSLVIMTPLNPSGHLKNSEAAIRPRPKNRTPQKAKRRPKTAPGDENEVRPAVGTLSRTKSLLLAALRVWELKNGIRE